MTETYTVTINDDLEQDDTVYSPGEQIAAAVYEAERRAVEYGEEVVVLLDHQEDPFPIRGRSEQGGAKRPDGGFTWYHAPDTTKCYMRSMPQDVDTFTRNHTDLQQDWADHALEVLSTVYPEDDLRYDPQEVDIYVRDSPTDNAYSKQIAGLSLHNSRDVKTGRMCWYAEDPLDDAHPASDVFETMLRQDDVDPDAFTDDLKIMDYDLFAVLEGEYDPSVTDADEFLSLQSLEQATVLQERKGGNPPTRCVGRQYTTETETENHSCEREL